jgi:hypothetical protein
MDGEKPFIEQMRENTPSAEDVGQNVSQAVQSLGETMNDMKDGVKDTLDEFSNKTMVDASSEFLNSNSLLAKFAFLVLVVVFFMVLLKIMMSILAYFLGPSSNPYLVYGSLNGNDRVSIPQDPSKDDTVQVAKSNDRHRGVEFTWSVWLFLNTTNDVAASNVFVKGDEQIHGEYNLLNGPGLYVKKDGDEYNLHVVMDHIGGEAQGVVTDTTTTTTTQTGRDALVVESIPIRKWVHVAIRMQNTMLDVYVNGTIAKRHNMEFAPKQNFNDVVVNANGGFSGKLSNLRYYAYALNVFELNNIVMWGPNTQPSDLSIDSRAKSGNYSYLSNMWYSNAYM